VFCRENFSPVDIVDNAALGAVSALGLDFGAVDVKCNRQGTRAAVLEVNTAPGLQGTTLRKYAEALMGLVSETRGGI
jgi:D-alanine-D-alanine ligase-like ATP-grasp enzyme